jgi:dihydroxyacetone kinase
MLHLSQGHLTLLETCPRRFQHSYLDQLSVPVAFDQQQRLNWGNQFHLLMQQRELGLPIHDLAGLEVSLQQSMETLIQAAPELFQPTSQSEPEQVRQS